MYLALVDPRNPGHYPTCPTLALTGTYCPGCGSLRAINRLVHGDLAGAWDYNILLVLVAPWLVWRWVKWLLAAIGRPVTTPRVPGWALYALAALVIAYWVLRNVPALEPYLAP